MHGVLPPSSLHIIILLHLSHNIFIVLCNNLIWGWKNNSSTWAHAQTKYTVSKYHTPYKIESWSQYTEHLKHYQLAPSCTGYCYMARMHARACTHTHTEPNPNTVPPSPCDHESLWTEIPCYTVLQFTTTLTTLPQTLVNKPRWQRTAIWLYIV